ncbi:hypothetical protein GUJ93_ZPchr2161g7122 [Zizania palustris]|uniref:Transcription repressor n=1 Tax=Zizania palustris TaxID=103762 RepID=A0A8J5VEJ8_ZIZPA|nr:hypothetical protein GUJ93_ZPchr2161g7122 [Zizania palustris]
MSPGAASKMRLGGGGFTLGCGCRNAKAVAVAASVASPCSGTETSTATTGTWRRARTHPSASASASTGTLTVPSASSSFLWDDAEAEADGEEIDCKRESSATTPSFSGLLRQLNELEQSVMSWGRKSPRSGNHFAPPPLPTPPPPPPLPLCPVKHRVVDGEGKRNNKDGHGSFSPPPPSSRFPTTQQHRKVKGVDQRKREEGDVHLTPPVPPPPPPLAPQQLRIVKSMDKGGSTEDGKHLPPPQAPKHRKAKSCDNDGFSAGKLDGSLAVVKQSEDPLSDFRRSMLNMIVENRIVTGDDLRDLLRRFLELNAPHHHDAILRAFTDIWDEVFAAPPEPRLDPPMQQPHQHRTPLRRRHPPPAWRL